MPILPTDYDNLKTLVAAKELTWDYLEYDTHYYVFSVENHQHFSTEIYKSGKAPKGEDQAVHDTNRTDFEANYKPNANKPTPLRMDPISAERWRLTGHAVVALVPQGTTVTIDFLMPEELYIHGGLVITKDAILGDWAKFQVVDVDGVLAPAGTVLATFIHKWFATENGEISIETEMASKVPSGLYLRCTFHSTGPTNDVGVAINYKLYKKLN